MCSASIYIYETKSMASWCIEDFPKPTGQKESQKYYFMLKYKKNIKKI